MLKFLVFSTVCYKIVVIAGINNVINKVYTYCSEKVEKRKFLCYNAFMKNAEYLWEANDVSYSLPHMINNSVLEYRSRTTRFDFKELKKLIGFFRASEKRYGNNRLIKYNVIYSEELQFADKLSYILLECFLYHQIVLKNKTIGFSISKYKNTIFTEGFLDSCLGLTNDRIQFEARFLSTISRFHYRKLIKYNDFKSNPQFVSVIMSDLSSFFTNCGITQNPSATTAEISAELIDNALDHSCADCLIDVDVSRTPYFHKDSPAGDQYFAVNIAVIDFSEKLLGEGIRRLAEDKNQDGEQYIKLRQIREKHSKYFASNYTEEQFYMLSAFQNKISSRESSKLTGGRGLTKLIKELQSSSVSDVCYVVTNNSCLFFPKEYIKQDSEQWVGFNKENDCNLPPSEGVFVICPINIIGTAFNLTFAFKKETENEN